MTNMNNREYSALMSAVNEIMEGRTVSIYENSSCIAEVKTEHRRNKEICREDKQGLQDRGKAECDANHCKLWT